MKSFLMEFLSRINRAINCTLFVGAIELFKNSMLLLPQGWLQGHNFILVLFKEVWMWCEDSLASLCFRCYQGKEGMQ